MASISEELEILTTNSNNIKSALEQKGVISVGGFNNYANEILSIPSGGGSVTGNIDRDGLTVLGYSTEEIDKFQSLVFWNEEQDELFKVTDYDKSYAGSSNPGSNCTYLPRAAFSGTIVSSNKFMNFFNLVIVVIPSGIVNIDSGAFGNCTNLTKLGHMDEGKSSFYLDFGSSSLTDTNLRELGTPGNLEGTNVYFSNTSIFQNSRIQYHITNSINTYNSASPWREARNLISLTSLSTYTPNLTGGYFLYNCRSCRFLDLPNVTGTVKALTGLSNFSGTHPDFKIRVPSNMVSKFKSASGWSGYSSKIISL